MVLCLYLLTPARLHCVTSEEIKCRGDTNLQTCEKVIQEEGLDALDNDGTGAA